MSSSRTLSIAIFFFYFSIFTLVSSGHLYSPDEEVMFRTTESITQFRGFAIEPITKEGDRFVDVGKDGNFYGHYGLGQPLIAVPFYYVGKILVKILPESWNVMFRRNTIQYHNMTFRENILRFAVSKVGQVTSALICLLLFHFGILLGYSRKNAFLLSLIYGVGTLALVFSKTFYSEPTATLFLLLAFYNLYRFRITGHWGLLLWSGALLGYAILLRMDSIITIPIFLGYLTLLYYKEVKKLFRSYLYFLIPLAFFCFLVGCYNYARFGSFTHTGYESEGLTFSYPFLDGLYGLLMSAGKSIFIYSPPILLFFPAIKKFWQEHREETLFCSGIALMYLLFYSKWESWAGGWTWGARHVFQIHVFLMIPVLALFERYIRRPHIVFWSAMALLVGVGIFVQIPGVLVSFMDYNFWFQQQKDLYYTLYFPVHSSIAGHWQILSADNVDLILYRLWNSDLSIFPRFNAIIFVLVMIATGGCIIRRLKYPSGT